MRTVANKIDLVIICRACQVTPSFRDYRTHPSLVHSFEHCLDEGFRIVNDNAAETNIDRWGTSVEKAIELGRRAIRWCVSKQKAAYVLKMKCQFPFKARIVQKAHRCACPNLVA